MNSLLLAAALLLTPFAATAQKSDAMPPEQNMAADSAMHHDKPPVPPSKFLNVTVAGKTTMFTVEELVNMPQVTVNVHNGHSNKDETYSGPLVSDVLAKAGFSPKADPVILHSSVVATGTDGYFVLYSAAELQPGFSTGKAIIAMMKSGLPNTGGGVIQMVNSSDAKPARWVHGLTGLNVMSLAPTK